MPHLPLWLVICATTLLAVAYGYCTGISQGCLRIGRGISDTGSKTGYQDAVSPPVLARTLIALNIMFIAVIGYSLWEFEILVSVGEVVGAFFVFGISTHLAPKSTAPYYARLTYTSLSRRAVNYAKHNDLIRATVAAELADEIAARFARELEASVTKYMGIQE